LFVKFVAKSIKGATNFTKVGLESRPTVG
jgi:hypothetical protein